MCDFYLFQDVKKCIGCHACEIQCKANKRLPIGPRLCQIVQVGPKLVGGVPRSAFIFMSCYHCEKPWCVAACPTGAMQKRSKDGIVFVESDACVGCKACIRACPWGAPQWNPETRKVVKCDFCMERLDKGLKPACVTICTSQCLNFGRVEEMTSVLRQRHAQSVASLDHAAF